ncbi:MAG: hypothetical protein R3194_08615 [Limnobacter sp.]|nr:hypothetical protein [Limnobacter sp.]
MQYHVVKLRHNGLRYPRHEILRKQPATGALGVINMPDEKGFPVKVAVLRSDKASINNCLAELLDPQIMAITSQAILLKGFERDEMGRESVQEWWCRFG